MKKIGTLTISALLPLLLLSLITGCLPSKFTIDLAPPQGLDPTTVIPGGHDRIALIEVSGLISQGEISPGLFATATNPVDRLVHELSLAEQDHRVKAVVLRINSPGGTVAASETMLAEIRGFKQRSGKPLVVSMSAIAASGGYYIALGGDKILAQSTTLTGSIGVIMQTFNFSSAMDRWGIQGRAVTSAPNKALASPFAPPVEAHYDILQDAVNDYYAQFKSEVLTSRPTLAALDPTTIAAATDGRVVVAQRALDIGLIDAIGGLRDAINLAQELAQTSGATVIRYAAPGTELGSPYASTPAPTPSTLGTTLNLSLLNLHHPATLPEGFYYLYQLSP